MKMNVLPCLHPILAQNWSRIYQSLPLSLDLQKRAIKSSGDEGNWGTRKRNVVFL